MKFLYALILSAFFALVIQQILPWWSIVPATFLIGLLPLSPKRFAFWAGFLGIALLWGGLATYLNVMNEGIMASRMGLLFGGLNGWALVFVTAVIGGVFGGLGLWTGTMARELLR